MKNEISELVKPIVTSMGYEMWGINIGQQNNSIKITLYIDSKAGIKIDDCEKVSYQVSHLLDSEELCDPDYILEVSSPGVERPLLKLAHYQRYIGSEIKVRLIWALDGQKNFKGELLRVESDNITMLADEVEVSFSIDTIKRAHLIYL